MSSPWDVTPPDEYKSDQVAIDCAYTPLREAGAGSFGNVTFCLRSKDIDATRTAVAQGAPLATARTNLLMRLVAYKSMKKYCLTREVRSLQIIHENRDHFDGGAHCPLLLDHDTDEFAPKWFALFTIPTVLSYRTLQDFLPKHPPVSLLWAMSTQLYSAVWFINRQCTPQIVHQDISPRNILISYPSTRRADPPHITLIDFGSSTTSTGSDKLRIFENARTLEVWKLVSVIRDLCKACYHYDRNGPGREARRKLNAFLYLPDGHIKVLEHLRVDLVEFARDQMRIVTNREWEELREIVLEAVKTENSRKGGPLMQKVDEVLEGA